MNEKAKNLLRNFKYILSANFLALIISVILNLVVPKFIGLTEYSYWQLYVFYSSYVGFFHFGWIDGIYLKIGGEEYEELDKRSLGTQFYYLFILQLILGLSLFLVSYFFVSDMNKKIILIFTAVVLVFTNLKTFILFILQSTNRIKDYAKLSISDRYFYIITAMSYLILGGRNFFVLILLDIISRIIVVIWGMGVIKDILFSKRQKFKEVFNEIIDNIRVGSNLMFGSIASLLILGVSRLFVEQKWNIEVFGELSFALSISNMFMIFINAISTVLYPVLRRTEQSNLPELYVKVRSLFVPITLLLLLFFNPMSIILEWWLPEYQSSLFFMGILFPMIIYEGRVSLLVNTYLKTIRKEKKILVSNVITLFVALTTSFISVYLFDNINLTVISIMFSLAFRCVLAEKMLTKVLKINVDKENIIEGVLVTIFIVSNVFLNNIISFLIYFLIFSLYIGINYKVIKNSFRYFLLLMRPKNTI